MVEAFPFYGPPSKPGGYDMNIRDGTTQVGNPWMRVALMSPRQKGLYYICTFSKAINYRL